MSRKLITKEIGEFLLLQRINDSIKRYCKQYVVSDRIVVPLFNTMKGAHFSVLDEDLSIIKDVLLNAEKIGGVKKSLISNVIYSKDLEIVQYSDRTKSKIDHIIMPSHDSDSILNVRMKSINKILKDKSPYIEISSKVLDTLSDNEEYVVLWYNNLNFRLTKGLIPSWRRSKGKEDTLSYKIIPISSVVSELIIKGDTFDGIVSNYHVYTILNVTV